MEAWAEASNHFKPSGSTKDYWCPSHPAKSHLLSDLIFPGTSSPGSNDTSRISSPIEVLVHAGKGAMDRMVPLPKITLLTLRKYYKTHRNPQWIFPALGHDGGKDAQCAKDPVSDSGVQGVLHWNVWALKNTFIRMFFVMLMQPTCWNIPIRHVQKSWAIKHYKAPWFICMWPLGLKPILL